jgi:hypothetical protein
MCEAVEVHVSKSFVLSSGNHLFWLSASLITS